jgi:CelD/BcsL family acetyltransferase involved in cellulose biosynthesis
MAWISARSVDRSGFRYGQRVLFYQTGFDPDYAKQGVGQVVIGLTIKHALEAGLDEYDLLHGDERYKFDWARQVRELERIELFPPGVRGSLQRGIFDLGRRVRRRGRQWLARGLAAAVTGGS